MRGIFSEKIMQKTKKKPQIILGPVGYKQKDVLLCHNVDPAAGELNGSVRHRKQGIITSHADVKAGFELRTTLSDDNRPGLSGLSAVQLNTPIFRVAVATVS